MKATYKRYSVLFLLSIAFSCGMYAEAAEVIPLGKTVGIKVYTDGLLVVGTRDVGGENIAKKYDIRVNDRITEVNGETVESCEQFSELVADNPYGLRLKIVRDGKALEKDVVPYYENDSYRLGLWVRDSTAGIGTVTYYNPETKSFAALGHCINDVDTGNILTVKSGNILGCDISSVTKSKRGTPGEINGVFSGGSIGDIQMNTEIGIFGKITSDEAFSESEAITVAAREQVAEGSAYILTDAFGDENNKYSIEIKKITSSSDKSLVIEITDERLLEMSGGIVQGMSGSPIIQNDMLVGAVTHVFVNNPSRGYGTLAENMIDVSEKM